MAKQRLHRPERIDELVHHAPMSTDEFIAYLSGHPATYRLGRELRSKLAAAA